MVARLVYHLKRILSLSGRSSSEPSSEEIKELLSSIRSSKLTYCGPPKLENLAEACELIRKDGIRGAFIEAGVALGGSAIVLGRLKPASSPLFLYDVFGLIPAPNENDGKDAHDRFADIREGRSAGLGGDTYYGYQSDLYEVVSNNLTRFGLRPHSDDIVMVPGLFQDTLHPQHDIALAHIDCDWFDSVNTCIDRIAPKLVVGGILVFDDYSSYEGCARAVNGWLERSPHFSVIFQRRSLGVRRTS